MGSRVCFCGAARRFAAMDIRRFAVTAQTAQVLRQGRVAAVAAEEERRRGRAETLGLPYPRPVVKASAGRPSRAARYLDALSAHVTGTQTMLGVSPEMPKGWVVGHPVLRDPDGVISFAEEIFGEAKPEEEATVKQKQEQEQEQEPVAEVQEEPGSAKNKRRCTTVDPPLRAWFCKFANLQRR